jgi:hypothetical protein
MKRRVEEKQEDERSARRTKRNEKKDYDEMREHWERSVLATERAVFNKARRELWDPADQITGLALEAANAAWASRQHDYVTGGPQCMLCNQHYGAWFVYEGESGRRPQALHVKAIQYVDGGANVAALLEHSPVLPQVHDLFSVRPLMLLVSTYVGAARSSWPRPPLGSPEYPVNDVQPVMIQIKLLGLWRAPSPDEYAMHRAKARCLDQHGIRYRVLGIDVVGGRYG